MFPEFQLWVFLAPILFAVDSSDRTRARDPERPAPMSEPASLRGPDAGPRAATCCTDRATLRRRRGSAGASEFSCLHGLVGALG